MRNEAHVGLVDAHPERDRGDDHDAVLADEAILVAGAHIGVEPGVIGQGRDAGLGEGCRHILHLGSRQAIDDTGIAGVTLGNEGLELGRRIPLIDDLVSDVWPIEARDKLRRVDQTEPLGDLLASQFVRGRGERHARHAGKTLGDDGEPDIFRAEIVSPLRDAMSLVDRKQRDPGLLEQRKAAWVQQALRRDVEQIEITGDEPALDRRSFVK